MELKELRDPQDVRLFNHLLNRYHKQGWKAGLSRMRYFVLVENEDGIEYWLAGAVIQDPLAFARSLAKYNIDMTHSYFLRRIARFVPKSKCGDILVDFLRLLAEKLRKEGKELLITMGLENHSNALYKHAGFKEIGVTKTGKPIFVLRLS